MKKREQIKTVFLYVIFSCYILLLFKILIWSRVSILELLDRQWILFRSVNLIPFDSINQYMSGNTDTIRRLAFGNVIGNIVIFIPLGLYLPLFKKNKRILVNFMCIFIVSLAVEILQGLLGIGVSDIDDIILNSLGGGIGILGYKFIALMLQNETKVNTVITILSAIIGLPVILYLLFMVKMRF